MGLGLGPFEMILIFAVLLLMFGAKRLPELASGMGKGIRDFKRSLSGLDEESIHASSTAPPPAVHAAPQQPAVEAETQPPAGPAPSGTSSQH